MSETELVEKLAGALAKHVPMAIPVSVDLWDLKSIGAYLKRSPEVVREKYACLPNFPRPVRLPAIGNGRSHALYKAREIIKWAESYSLPAISSAVALK